MRIQRATMNDLARSYALARRFLVQTPFPDVIPQTAEDDREAFDSLGAMINNGAVFIAVHDDGDVVGIIGGQLTSFWWKQSARIALEMLWYVDESARGGRAALLTLNAFEDWAREHGARFTMMQAGVDPQSPAVRVLKKRGYQVQGPMCMKELT